MSKALKVGVIGLGFFGARHASLYAEHLSAELIGVCDRDPDCTDQGFYVVDDAGTAGGDTHLWPEINGRIVGDLADALDHFIKASLSGKPYLQDFREAFDAIPVLDALAQSARTGLPVDVAR